MKVCTQCGLEKDYSEFYHFKYGKDGYRAECKACTKERSTAYRIENPTKQKEWNEANREALKRKRRIKTLERKYGMSMDEYKALLKSQNGVCAICGQSETRRSPNRLEEDEIAPLAVDHDHNTGEVRGLLCASCNQGIGLLKENKDVLLSAIRYLESPSI